MKQLGLPHGRDGSASRISKKKIRVDIHTLKWILFRISRVIQRSTKIRMADIGYPELISKVSMDTIGYPEAISRVQIKSDLFDQLRSRISWISKRISKSVWITLDIQSGYPNRYH